MYTQCDHLSNIMNAQTSVKELFCHQKNKMENDRNCVKETIKENFVPSSMISQWIKDQSLN